MLRATIAAGCGALLFVPVLGLAQTPTLTCEDDWEGDGERVCEVRDFTLAAGAGVIAIDGGANGGIRVRGWDRADIRLFARVQAHATDLDRARTLAGGVGVVTEGTIRARGPNPARGEWWSVSFEAFVPERSNLQLEAVNGGIRIQDVHGRIRFQVTNGGVSLAGIGGDLEGRSTNGGIQLTLDGPAWDGVGADVRTMNGGIVLTVPEGYAAHVETGTTNGALKFDFPVSVQGRVNRLVEFDLGEGGPPIRAITTNGGVVLRRAGI